MNCRECGHANGADARFCHKCGRPMNVAAEPSASTAALPPSQAPDAAQHSSQAPDAAQRLAQAPSATAGPSTNPRPISKVRIALTAVLLVLAAGAYWWFQQPPGDFKPDNGGLYAINDSGKYGFMDRTGKTVISPQFDLTYGFTEGLAPVLIGTKFGYINTKGVIAITPQFDDVREFRYGRAVVQLCCGRNSWNQPNANNRFGIIDKDGKYVSSPDLLWTGSSFAGGFLPIKSADGRIGFVDRSGKVVISGEFTSVTADGFSGGLAPASNATGKWGFIDAKGKWAIEPQFERAGGFADGLAGVNVGGRVGFIGRNGKFVVNPQYNNAADFHDGYAAVLASTGKWGVIDTKGRMVLDAKYASIPYFSEGLSPMWEPAEPGSNRSGFTGFMDPTGKMVVNAQFDGAGAFANGLASVFVLGKQAYITKTGAFVVNPFPGMTLGDARAQAFLGKWTFGNGVDSIEVSRKADGLVVVWKSAAQLYSPIEVNCRLYPGALVGDYYGGKGNFQLSKGGNFLYLTIDPFAEFQPIRNQAFSKTQP